MHTERLVDPAGSQATAALAALPKRCRPHAEDSRVVVEDVPQTLLPASDTIASRSP